MDLRTDCAIGVMAKSPRIGYSKTRLCPPLRPEQAARLSAAFLRDTTETVRAAAASVPIAGYVAYAPAGTEEALTPYLAPDTPLILADGSVPAPAGVEGFGRCLLHAVQALFDRGHAAACVLSADTPTLPTAALITAATLLLIGTERHAVIGACDDGGYYLLGMRQPHAGLFADIAWSTDTVAAQTRDRAAALGLDLVELPLWYDIDDAASLDRLAQETSGSNTAPWTRHAIEAIGLPEPMRSSCFG
jgi:rSAM/selenodomain-associated transferase 1